MFLGHAMGSREEHKETLQSPWPDAGTGSPGGSSLQGCWALEVMLVLRQGGEPMHLPRLRIHREMSFLHGTLHASLNCAVDVGYLCGRWHFPALDAGSCPLALP